MLKGVKRKYLQIAPEELLDNAQVIPRGPTSRAKP